MHSSYMYINLGNDHINSAVWREEKLPALLGFLTEYSSVKAAAERSVNSKLGSLLGSLVCMQFVLNTLISLLLHLKDFI